jgi:hypothetical protein
MERCPNCRARVSDQVECRRCGMDLRLLLVTEQAADALLRRAVARLANGDRAGALATLRAARRLRQDPLCEQSLRAVARTEQGSVRHPGASTAFFAR